MEDLKLEDEAPASSADGLKGSLLSVLASRSLGNLGKIAPRIASSAGPRRASRPRDSGTIVPFQDTIPLASSGASGSAGNVERGPEDGSSGSSRIHVVVAKKTTLLTEATAALAAEERLVSGELQIVDCRLGGQQTRSAFLIVFSPDKRLMASTHGDHNVYVSQVSDGTCLKTLKGHPRTPWCIAFHPSLHGLLASGCLGGQVRVWDLLGGGSEVWRVDGVIASLAFHPSERLLVVASANELHFWDWASPTPVAKISTASDKEKVRYVKFDALGHQLITGIANLSGRYTPSGQESAAGVRGNIGNGAAAGAYGRIGGRVPEGSMYGRYMSNIGIVGLGPSASMPWNDLSDMNQFHPTEGGGGGSGAFFTSRSASSTSAMTASRPSQSHPVAIDPSPSTTLRNPDRNPDRNPAATVGEEASLSAGQRLRDQSSGASSWLEAAAVPSSASQTLSDLAAAASNRLMAENAAAAAAAAATNSDSIVASVVVTATTSAAAQQTRSMPAGILSSSSDPFLGNPEGNLAAPEDPLVRTPLTGPEDFGGDNEVAAVAEAHNVQSDDGAAERPVLRNPDDHSSHPGSQFNHSSGSGFVQVNPMGAAMDQPILEQVEDDRQPPLPPPPPPMSPPGPPPPPPPPPSSASEDFTTSRSWVLNQRYRAINERRMRRMRRRELLRELEQDMTSRGFSSARTDSSPQPSGSRRGGHFRSMDDWSLTHMYRMTYPGHRSMRRNSSSSNSGPTLSGGTVANQGSESRMELLRMIRSRLYGTSRLANNPEASVPTPPTGDSRRSQQRRLRGPEGSEEGPLGDRASTSGSSPNSDHTYSSIRASSISSQSVDATRVRSSMDVVLLSRHIDHMQKICRASLADCCTTGASGSNRPQQRRHGRLLAIRRMLGDLQRQIASLRAGLNSQAASAASGSAAPTPEATDDGREDEEEGHFDLVDEDDSETENNVANDDGQQQREQHQELNNATSEDGTQAAESPILLTSSGGRRSSSRARLRYSNSLRRRRQVGSGLLRSSPPMPRNTRTSNCLMGARQRLLTRAHSRLVSQLRATFRAMDHMSVPGQPSAIRASSSLEASRTVMEKTKKESNVVVVHPRKRLGDASVPFEQRKKIPRSLEPSTKGRLALKRSLNSTASLSDTPTKSRRQVGPVSTDMKPEGQACRGDTKTELRALSQRLEGLIRQAREASSAMNSSDPSQDPAENNHLSSSDETDRDNASNCLSSTRGRGGASCQSYSRFLSWLSGDSPVMEACSHNGRCCRVRMEADPWHASAPPRPASSERHEGAGPYQSRGNGVWDLPSSLARRWTPGSNLNRRFIEYLPRSLEAQSSPGLRQSMTRGSGVGGSPQGRMGGLRFPPVHQAHHPFLPHLNHHGPGVVIDRRTNSIIPRHVIHAAAAVNNSGSDTDESVDDFFVRLQQRRSVTSGPNSWRRLYQNRELDHGFGRYPGPSVSTSPPPPPAVPLPLDSYRVDGFDRSRQHLQQQIQRSFSEERFSGNEPGLPSRGASVPGENNGMHGDTAADDLSGERARLSMERLPPLRELIWRRLRRRNAQYNLLENNNSGSANSFASDSLFSFDENGRGGSEATSSSSSLLTGVNRGSTPGEGTQEAAADHSNANRGRNSVELENANDVGQSRHREFLSWMVDQMRLDQQESSVQQQQEAVRGGNGGAGPSGPFMRRNIVGGLLEESWARNWRQRHPMSNSGMMASMRPQDRMNMASSVVNQMNGNRRLNDEMDRNVELLEEQRRRNRYAYVQSLLDLQQLHQEQQQHSPPERRIPQALAVSPPPILPQYHYLQHPSVAASNSASSVSNPGMAAAPALNGVGSSANNMLLTHRIQSWDFYCGGLPNLRDDSNRVVVREARIHNDASVDISEDGAVLVTLVPSNLPMTTTVGVYGLKPDTNLGRCYATYSLESSAVSVSLSPTTRNLIVGLATRAGRLGFYGSDRTLMAQIFQIQLPWDRQTERGRLVHRKDLHQAQPVQTSLNCIRWIPVPGQGLVYATNTGLLKILR